MSLYEMQSLEELEAALEESIIEENEERGIRISEEILIRLSNR
jgi:hypothetical protein